MTTPEDSPFHEQDPFFGDVRLDFDIDSLYPADTDPAGIFVDLTKYLQSLYDIRRGVLILREADGTRYVATALVSPEGERKNLNLILPSRSSLIEQAALGGQIHWEQFFGSFSGNNLEKGLLVDSETEAFMLYPVKYEGEIVAMICFNSDSTDAFVCFDSGILDQIAEQLGRRIFLNLSATAH